MLFQPAWLLILLTVGGIYSTMRTVIVALMRREYIILSEGMPTRAMVIR